MPRGLGRAVLLTALLVGAASGGVTAPALAQEATPAAVSGIGGIDIQFIGFADSVTLENPADVAVTRLRLDPGVTFPLAANENEPTSVIFVVESGALTAQVDGPPWAISRGATLRDLFAGTPGAGSDLADAIETVSAGEATTVIAGDVAFVPERASGEVRNDGPEPVTALMILVGPATSLGEGTPVP